MKPKVRGQAGAVGGNSQRPKDLRPGQRNRSGYCCEEKREVSGQDERESQGLGKKIVLGAIWGQNGARGPEHPVGN